MAGRKAKTVSLTEISGSVFGVTAEAIRLWRKEGMPTRMVSGELRFVVSECVRWRRERDRAERASGPDDNGRQDKLRALRAEADLKELDLRERLGHLVERAEFEETVETFVGGFVAAVMGRLQQFERDVVQAQTPQTARAVMDRIQEEVLRAAREYADAVDTMADETEDTTDEEAA